MSFKRIPGGTVTEALMKALEQAENMDSVIIIAQGKGDTMYAYESADSTLAQCLWLNRCYEDFLMRAARNVKE